MLTYWLPMTSILFWVVRNCYSWFKSNYLKNEFFYSISCSVCGIYIKFSTISKKRWSSSLIYFRYYRLSKTWLYHSQRSAVSKHSLAVNMLKGYKHLWNLKDSTFIIFSISLGGIDLQNISLIDMSNLRDVC